MKSEGQSVLFSTHITSDLEKIADKLILINNGAIVFEKEKDELLDEYRIVKGKISSLKEEYKNLFLNLETSSYSFKGLTKDPQKVHMVMDDIIFERPIIEDVVGSCIEGRLS